MIHRHTLLVAGFLTLFIAGSVHAQSRFFDVTIENTGVYFVRMTTGSIVKTRSMTLLG